MKEATEQNIALWLAHLLLMAKELKLFAQHVEKHFTGENLMSEFIQIISVLKNATITV